MALAVFLFATWITLLNRDRISTFSSSFHPQNGHHNDLHTVPMPADNNTHKLRLPGSNAPPLGQLPFNRTMSPSPYTSIAPHITVSKDQLRAASQRDAKCLSLLLYDKPPKTGSTSVVKAIELYFASLGLEEKRCWNPHCLNHMHAVLNRSELPAHIFGHVDPGGYVDMEDGKFVKEVLYEGLKRLGYYFVTSIREPRERWKSMYFFIMHKQRKNFAGFTPNSTFTEFMRYYPDCVLYNYYDGLGKDCDFGKIAVEERLKRIVRRYDEIIEVGEQSVQDFEGRIARHLNVLNVAPRSSGYEEESDVAWGRLENEQMLYKALKKVRLDNAKKRTERKFC